MAAQEQTVRQRFKAREGQYRLDAFFQPRKDRVARSRCRPTRVSCVRVADEDLVLFHHLDTVYLASARDEDKDKVQLLRIRCI